MTTTYRDALTWDGAYHDGESWGDSTLVALGSVTFGIAGHVAVAGILASGRTVYKDALTWEGTAHTPETWGDSTVLNLGSLTLGIAGHVAVAGAIDFTDTGAAPMSLDSPVSVGFGGHVGLSGALGFSSAADTVVLGGTVVGLRGRVGFSLDTGFGFIGGTVFLEQSIFSALRGLVADRVYPDYAPDKSPTPYITYQQVGGISVNFLDRAVPSKKRARVQVNVWGTTRREVALLSRRVEDALRSAYELQPSIEGAPVAVWEPGARMRGSHQDFAFTHDF